MPRATKARPLISLSLGPEDGPATDASTLPIPTALCFFVALWPNQGGSFAAKAVDLAQRQYRLDCRSSGEAATFFTSTTPRAAAASGHDRRGDACGKPGASGPNHGSKE